MRLLLSLELRRVANSLRHLFRSPLRLAGALLVLAVLGASIGSQVALLLMPLPPWLAAVFEARLAPHLPQFRASLFGVLLFTTYGVVSSGLEGRLLVFTPPDIDLLFPAPLPRRVVLLHRLLLEYLRLATTVVMFMLLLGGLARFAAPRSAAPGLAAATSALILYLVMVLNLSHLAYLLVNSQTERWRHLPTALRALFGLGVVVLAGLALRSPSWSGGLAAALSTRAAWAVLFPLLATWELLLAPLQGLPPQAALKLGLLAGGALVSVLALLARPHNLYEPSMTASLLRAELRAALRAGDQQRAAAVLAERRRGSRRLRAVPPLGTGAWALGWKSLTMQLRAPGQAAALLLLATLAMPLLAAAFLRQIHHHALLRQAPLLVVYLAWSTGVGLFRGQQAELKKVDLLKSLPIPAWSLVLAQTAPAVVGWSLAVCGGLGVLAWAAPEVDRQLCLAVGLAVPALMALVSTSNAALAMIFPASTDPAQVALGQTMLLGCSGLVAAPGMVVGAVLWSLDHPPIAVGLATGGVFGLTAVLCLVVAAALYRRFDPTD